MNAIVSVPDFAREIEEAERIESESGVRPVLALSLEPSGATALGRLSSFLREPAGEDVRFDSSALSAASCATALERYEPGKTLVLFRKRSDFEAFKRACGEEARTRILESDVLLLEEASGTRKKESEGGFFDPAGLLSELAGLIQSGYSPSVLKWTWEEESCRLKASVRESGFEGASAFSAFSPLPEHAKAWESFLKWAVSYAIMRAELASRGMRSKSADASERARFGENLAYFGYLSSFLNQLIQDFNIWSELDSPSGTPYETDMPLADYVACAGLFGLWIDFLAREGDGAALSCAGELFSQHFAESSFFENQSFFRIWTVENLRKRK